MEPTLSTFSIILLTVGYIVIGMIMSALLFAGGMLLGYHYQVKNEDATNDSK